MVPKTSNQAVPFRQAQGPERAEGQRTASSAAIYLPRVCHPPFACVARFTELAVADLVSR